MHDSCVCLTCKNGKMTILKGKHSLLRYLGFVAAIFAFIQGIIWLILSFTGIICFYAKCGGTRHSTNKFGTAFNNIYLNTKTSKAYSRIVTPIFFHVLMWFYVVLSLIWIYASISLTVDYRRWSDGKKLRKISKRWIIVTIVVCAFDLLVFMLFVVDFSLLKQWNLSGMVRSSDTSEYDDGSNDDYYTDNAVARGMWDDISGYDDYDTETTENIIDSEDTIQTEDPTKLDRTIKPADSTKLEDSSSVEDRVQQMKKDIANRRELMEDELKRLLSIADKILATETKNYFNPMVRMKTEALIERIKNLEKLIMKFEKQTGKSDDKSANETETSNKRRRPAPKGKPKRVKRTQKFVEETDELEPGEYEAVWRSTFEDIFSEKNTTMLLELNRNNTEWRRTSSIGRSNRDTDMVLAPSATMMTLAIRGFLVWIFNLSAALMLLYLYITRPRRPTLLTRIQA